MFQSAGYPMGVESYVSHIKSRAQRKFWDKQPGPDKTEEIIRNTYMYQPKRMNYALEKHMQGKWDRQIIAEKQFDQRQAYLKQSKELRSKYDISDNKNAEIKEQYGVA